MSRWKTDDVVWTNLGISYGWWPAVIHEKQRKKKDEEEAEEDGITVRFFDDDKFESYYVPQTSLVQAYSGEHKIALIKEGLEKLSAVGKSSILGDDSRQSQFIKDVEMAEVLTDNCPEVAEILSSLVFLDGVQEPVKKKRRCRKKRN